MKTPEDRPAHLAAFLLSFWSRPHRRSLANEERCSRMQLSMRLEMEQSEGIHRRLWQTLGSSATVLLVEDEPAVRGLFGDALRKAGYSVVEADNGAEALKIFDDHGRAIDLLVTDIMMPYVNGSELVAQVRPSHPDLRVVFISAYQVQRDEGPQSRFLSKPFTRAELLQTVHDILHEEAQG